MGASGVRAGKGLTECSLVFTKADSSQFTDASEVSSVNFKSDIPIRFRRNRYVYFYITTLKTWLYMMNATTLGYKGQIKRGLVIARDAGHHINWNRGSLSNPIVD